MSYDKNNIYIVRSTFMLIGTGVLIGGPANNNSITGGL